MRKVTIEELQEGDEIIIPNLRYLKVLKTPSLSDKKGWGKIIDSQGYFKWEKNTMKYKTVLCSFRVDEIEYKYKSDSIRIPDRIIKDKKHIFETNCSQHNKRSYIDLNNKTILLIKRKEK